MLKATMAAIAITKDRTGRRKIANPIAAAMPMEPYVRRLVNNMGVVRGFQAVALTASMNQRSHPVGVCLGVARR